MRQASRSAKLLAVDLDGTLLAHDGSIRPDDARALARLRAAGIPVSIITGRLYSGSIAAALAAGIEGPIACVDGSQIVDTRGDRVLYHRTIAGEHASAVRRVLERHGPASFLFAEDAIVHDRAGEPFAPYVRTWSPKISVVEELTSHPVWEQEHGFFAVVAVGPESAIAGAVEEIRAQLSHAAFVASFALHRFEGTHALLVRAKGPTKGTAVSWLADHYRCDAAEVVVVGDWLNDIPMFDVAGRSFAMGQAPEAVKRAATDRLEADVEVGGGVAEAIRRTWDL